MARDRAPARAPIDWGRLLAVPLFTGILVINALSLSHELALGYPGQSTASAVLSGVARLLTCMFFAFTLMAYMTRIRARATTPAWTPRLAAMVATPLPGVVPLLAAGEPGSLRSGVADGLLVVGLAASAWALLHLRRSFSIIAQARAVVTSGPYRFVRHPLYVAEVTSTLGLAVLAGSWPALGAWLVLCLLQAYRARHEEGVLVAALPEYRDYQRRTARLVPGLS